MPEASRKKLQNTPFNTVDEMKKAQAEIEKEIWYEAERALTFQKIVLNEPRFKPLREVFEIPWKGFMKPETEEIISFTLTKEGAPSFTINDKIQDVNGGAGFLEGLIRGGFGVYTAHWMSFRKLGPNSAKLSPEKIEGDR